METQRYDIIIIGAGAGGGMLASHLAPSGKKILDLNCRTHDVDNLYVVDSSFYPSSAALNSTHTLLANALRVGDHLLEHM